MRVEQCMVFWDPAPFGECLEPTMTIEALAVPGLHASAATELDPVFVNFIWETALDMGEPHTAECLQP